MENVMLFYVVLYMILGLVIYHSIFEIWYFNFGKAMIAEIFGAFIFAALMTGLTLKFWWLALIIIVLIGLVMSAKVQNPTGKKIVLGVFIVVAIITAVTGIKFNNQEKEKESVIMTQSGYSFDDWYNDNYKGKKTVYFKLTVPMDNGTHLSEQSTVLVVYPYLSGYDVSTNITMKDAYVKDWDWVDYNWVADDQEPGTMLCSATFKENTKDIPGDSAYFNISDVKVLAKTDEAYADFDEDFNVISYYSQEDSEDDYYDDVDYEYENESSYSDEEDNYDDEQIEENEDYEDGNGDYIIANSSQAELTEDDLQGLSAQELTYARNEIYARHGYIFNSSELNEYFNSKSWYQADDSFSGTLEGVEQKNAAFISEYQTQNGLEYSPQ